ncbi:MAG: CHRD domain-containing protein [Chitinophagaceae bacterium]|nr:MAG: CHRD domain-containing protein [Chitinophagaceae bacterium]
MNRFYIAAAGLLLLASCKKDDVDVPAPTGPDLVRQWTLSLSPRNENPAPAGRTETGQVVIQLFSDNTIKYNLTVTGLAAGDALTAAHIHTGDPVTNGPVILNFAPAFTNNTASGTITGVRQSFRDSLVGGTAELYFNVHSTQVASGLLRAQVNRTNELSMDVALSGANEVPAVTTTATGTALLRLMTDKTLYTKVTVTNLEAGDALTAAHIHEAAAGANGPIIVPIYSAASEFGTTKMTTLTDDIYNKVKNNAVYFNAHSTLHASGLIRGQIR